LSENVQKRMEASLQEMKERHEQGTNEVDDPDRAPTGEPYRRMQQQSLLLEKQRRAQQQEKHVAEMQHLKQVKENIQNDASDSDDSDDDDWLLDDDDDPTLQAIRQARLLELKAKQTQHAENVAKGHGQYRTITQDEFLPECTSSNHVAVHFFHKEFERCKIMDFHLRQIAPLHTSCKFVRMDAEKAPFFVAKLQIKTLPTLLVFHDGKTVERLTGFDGLAKDPSKPDEWHTGRLQEWLNETGAIEYSVPTEEVQEEMERLGLTPRGAIWRGGVAEYDEEDE